MKKKVKKQTKAKAKPKAKPKSKPKAKTVSTKKSKDKDKVKVKADKEGLNKDIEKLVALGKKKGFLTYDEVNDALSDSVESSEEIDKVFDVLDGKDIKIVETEDEDEKAQKKVVGKESREQEIRRIRGESKEDDVYSDKFIPLDDPVKMYLKQMGSIPLLSRLKELKKLKFVLLRRFMLLLMHVKERELSLIKF